MSVNVFRVCAIGAFSIVTALPQDAATAVYKKQLDDLHAQYSRVLVSAEQMDSTNLKARLSLTQEEFALLRLVHRLSETALEANLQGLKSGQPENPALKLVSLTCDAMGYVLTSIQNYADTGNPIFLNLARSGDALVSATQKAM